MGMPRVRSDTVAGLLDALVLPLYYDGRMETVEEWLGWFGDDELVRYPALAVYGAWLRALTGRPAEAERWLALADGATSAIPLSDGSATIEPWVANLRGAHDAATVSTGRWPTPIWRSNGSHPSSGWIPLALLIRGVAHALLGATDRATDDLTAAVQRGLAIGAFEDVYVAACTARAARHAGRARGARPRGAHAPHRRWSRRPVSATTPRARSRTWRRHASRCTRGDRRTRARGAGPRAPAPAAARPRRSLADDPSRTRADPRASRARRGGRRAHGPRRDRARARAAPGDGHARRRCARDCASAWRRSSEPAGAWAMSLTGAELRLLPYLATHLTFPEIASRLFISRNTVKTEAVSIYRKLGASSRSEAIERAVEVGLLESSIYPPRADFTLEG